MDIKDTPVISFITICYNGLADTCALIESLYNVIHSVSYEIIVVDNASSPAIPGLRLSAASRTQVFLVAIILV